VIVRVAFFVHLSIDVKIASDKTVFYRTKFRSQLEMVLLQIHLCYSKRVKDWNIAAVKYSSSILNLYF
jgi:hypothetical protein